MIDLSLRTAIFVTFEVELILDAKTCSVRLSRVISFGLAQDLHSVELGAGALWRLHHFAPRQCSMWNVLLREQSGDSN